MLVLNNRYYFNNEGKAVVPTDEEIREVHRLDERFKVVKAEFPEEGYGIKQGISNPYYYPYETLEEAKAGLEERIQEEIKYYRNMIK